MLTTRRTVALGAALLAAAGLAACTSSSSSSSSGATTTGSSSSALVVADVAPFSGPDAALGPTYLVSCDGATQAIDNAGGVLGHKLTCKGVDTRGDPADAVPATTQMFATAWSRRTWRSPTRWSRSPSSSGTTRSRWPSATTSGCRPGRTGHASAVLTMSLFLASFGFGLVTAAVLAIAAVGFTMQFAVTDGRPGRSCSTRGSTPRSSAEPPHIIMHGRRSRW
jgi:hypothetical protein